MSFNPMRVVFMVEILLAELIFLYSAEKRSYFPLRYIISAALCIVIAGFYPFSSAGQLGQFIMFILLFAVSVAFMGLCFKMSVPALISSCVAGYAVEHTAFHINKILMSAGFMDGVIIGPLSGRILAEIISFPVIYLIVFFTIGLYASKNQSYRRVDMRFNYLSIVIILLCIGLTRVAGYFGDQNSITVSLYAIVVCVMALFVQLVLSKEVELRHENEAVHLMWQEERRQYEISKKAIDTINIKYHDLKHRLRDMNLPPEDVNAIKDAVRVYGSRVKTGNEALDVLLTENALHLGEQGITLTYMGNGADLGFMHTMDVYSLFGNAIDNAVEAVKKVNDPEKRVIDIVMERMGNMVNINVSNFFDGEITLEDGVPVTSKKTEEGFHGFGMKSMKLIAEKYGGSLSVKVDGGVFSLSIYLMQP